jgi:carbamoyl-phosphate synthase large subunit
MAVNVLVTGCGGDIGQSIGKILKESNLISNLIGTDLNDRHAGIFIYDKCETLPRCSSPDYILSLNKIITDNKVDVLIPVSEAEIRFFFQNGFDELTQVKVLISNREALDAGLDKLKTAEFLERNQLVFPLTYLVQDSDKLQFPFIAKSRNGSGSKNVMLIENKDELVFLNNKFSDFLVQEYLPEASEEYTCGLFRSTNGVVRHITYRRELIGGFSGYGEVVYNKDINLLLEKMAEKLNLVGAINVQLRLSKKGPCVFEINPRFSSTVRFRDLMGFNDVVWAMEDILGLNISEYTPVQEGMKFYKGYNEYIN